MAPNLLMQGILQSGNQESSCKVRQRLAGQGKASRYTEAEIVDSSVSPPLQDGIYMFHYLGEANAPVEVKRDDGGWLMVPPSAKLPSK